MSNPHKGEVELVADGVTYTIRFGSNALCELESALDRGIMDILSDIQSWEKQPRRIRFGTIRAVLWSGLREHHSEIDVKSAGDLMLAAGGIIPVMTVIMKAIGLAFSDEKSAGGEGPPKPSRSKRGTGSAS